VVLCRRQALGTAPGGGGKNFTSGDAAQQSAVLAVPLYLVSAWGVRKKLAAGNLAKAFYSPPLPI